MFAGFGLEMKTARKFLISGIVQGVGFRFFTQRIAARHQVVGYVTNLNDGRVEVLAQGDESSVANFRDDLAAGSTNSHVELIEEIHVEFSKSYSAFRIER